MLTRRDRRPIRRWDTRQRPWAGPWRRAPAVGRRTRALIARQAARQRLVRIVLASALLHAVIMLAVLYWPASKPAEPQSALPAPVAMVFEPPSDGMRAAPTPSPTDMPTPPMPQAAPEAAPTPERVAPTEPPPPVAPPTQTAEDPPPPVEPVPEVQEAMPLPPPPMPPPPVPAPEVPGVDPGEAPAATAEALPIPPLLVPPPPRPAPPRPAPAPRPPSPVAAAPPRFPTPRNYSFGPAEPARPGQAPAPPPAFGPSVPGDMSFGQFAKVTQGRVDASWLNALQAWWDRNGYYPRQAAALRQDGRVRLELVVERSGKVRSLELIGRSGSQFLDLGALAVFRGAALPPFPANSTEDHITLELSIDYILVGG